MVYLQDESTGEIIQAATIPEYTSVSIFDRLEPLSGVLLYPNPARELANLERGLYTVEVRTRNKRQVLYRDKLFHY